MQSTQVKVLSNPIGGIMRFRHSIIYLTKNKVFLVIAFIFLCEPAFAQFKEIKAESNFLTIVEKSGATRKFSFNGTINGYQTNCARSILIAWGSPDERDFNRPQIGYIAIVEVGNKRPVLRKITSKELIDANFLKNGKVVELIDSYRSLLNLKSKKIDYSVSDTEAEPQELESCTKERWQSFKRWSSWQEIESTLGIKR